MIKLGAGYIGVLQKTRGNSIDTSAQTVALIGDSITSQNISSNDQEYLSQGYMTMLNAITGQRYNLPPAHVLGVSGDSVAEMDTRKTDLAALDPAPDLVVVLGGTNDIVAATTEAAMKASLQSIYDYVTGTLGAKVIALTIPPRTQHPSGDALLTADQTKLDNVNDWIMAKDGDITPINIYDNLTSTGDNPDPAKFNKEGTSGTSYLHPNPAGSLQVAKDMAAVLNDLYGTSSIPDMTQSNLLANDDLSGTGGTISGNLTGDVADSNTLYTYSQATGTASKPTANTQQIDVNYSNNTAFDTVQFYEADVTTGYTAGNDVLIEAEIEILNATRVEGIWVEATDKGGSNLVYKGLTKYDDPEFPTEAATYYLQSPVFTTQGDSTAIAPKIRGELNSASGETARLNFIIKQWRLYELPAASAEVSDPSMNSVVSGCVFDIDFTNTDCYSGTGTAVNNLVPTPADGEAQSAYDFTASGMTFHGTAGDSGAYVTFVNGNTLQLSANTDFINRLHNDQDFTFVAVVESFDGTWLNGGLFGTSRTSSQVGLRMLTQSSERLQLTQYSGGAVGAQVAGTTTTATTGDMILGVSYDHTANEVTFWESTSTGETVSMTMAAETAIAANVFQVAGIAGGQTMNDTQWGWKSFTMWNLGIGDIGMAAAIPAYESRHATTLTV